MPGASSAQAPVLSVSEINAYLRRILLQQDALQDLWIRGEVSNVSPSRASHIFFSLKDDTSVLKCVVWASRAVTVKRYLTDGQEVLAHGHIDLYPQQGVYQLYVDDVIPVGAGLRFLEFEQLKKKLQDEGLFASERKRPLPAFPQRIGVVTSIYGAARRDIEKVIAHRWPAVELLLSHTGVQGDSAPAEIVTALQRVAAQPVDVIILARGGGSQEDLWCFNDERVARAIAAMPVPVVTGIGHEVDFTIADFVADLRTPTPSAAAAAVVPDQEQVIEQIVYYAQTLLTSSQEQIGQLRTDLCSQAKLLRRFSPESTLANLSQSLDSVWQRLHIYGSDLSQNRFTSLVSLQLRLLNEAPRFGQTRLRLESLGEGLQRTLPKQIAEDQQALNALNERINALSPQATLKRGYAIVHLQSATGRIVSEVKQIKNGDVLHIQFTDGQATTVVTDLHRLDDETKNIQE